MEFKDLSEKIEWEARRVATAFEIAQWESGMDSVPDVLFHEGKDRANNFIRWDIYSDGIQAGQWKNITISVRDTSGYLKWFIMIDNTKDGYLCDNSQQSQAIAEAMIRGLYRLGFEDPTIVAQLPPLSAHEKFELRLSMPREFWPKQWLDEEEK